MFFDNLFSDFNPFGSYTYRQPRREDPFSYPSEKSSIILRKLLNDEYNYICFDCHCEIESLDYFDVKNGTFLCYSCAQRHTQLPKEVSQVMTGNIRNMEEKDLLILYYGGNKNLIDFIRRHFPLLENMQPKEMYCSKAMDYYRKLLRAKAFDEKEPDMPGKKKGYKSIFFNKINNPSPSKENQSQSRNTYETRQRQRENEEDNNDENNDDNDNIFSTTFFGDDLFGRNRRNQRKRNEENKRMQTEPAVIENTKKEKDDANAENTNTYKKINKTKINETQNKKEKKEEKKENNTQIKNVVTINQIGELNRYPDAMEIDGMECEE